jgi:LacI family transcriptional regulator
MTAARSGSTKPSRAAPDGEERAAARAGRPRARRATLADVAAELGVSPATASRALRGDERISEPTRQAVREIAERLHYVPNAAARSLAVRRSRTLGLLLADFADPFHGQVATGFEAVATSLGYTAIIVPGSGFRKAEERAIRVLVEYGTEGIAIAGGVLEPREAQRLATPQPLVFVHPEYRGILSRGWVPPHGTIRFDDTGAVDEAVRYLLDQGYRDLAYVGSGRWPSQGLRQRSASSALRAAGMRPLRSLSVATDAWREPGAVGEVVIRDTMPEAVLCYDDTLALALIHDLQVAGVRVPDDIAVVGFDGIPFAALSNPGLTTVATPTVEMGRLAASGLVEAIDTGRLPPAIVLPTMLVVRESTRPGPAA